MGSASSQWLPCLVLIQTLNSLKVGFRRVAGELRGPIKMADRSTEFSSVQGSFLISWKLYLQCVEVKADLFTVLWHSFRDCELVALWWLKLEMYTSLKTFYLKLCSLGCPGTCMLTWLVSSSEIYLPLPLES